ncbi:MAG: hypothetical protein HYY12_01345, partial [Candidatus Methylomirabilis oxyfera]|nr:hypothetical protein [Candidatus Methylomirabilis oxyfera]
MLIRLLEQSQDLLARQAAEIGARLLSGNDALLLTGLFGASKAPMLSEISRQAGRPLLVMTSSSAEAESLAKDLQFFSREPVGFLPEREEDPEIRRQRIACLAGLAAGELRLAVASIQATLERLPPPNALMDAAIPLRAHGQIPRDKLLRALETAGYRQAHQVTDRGEYSLRGNLLDLFPPTGDAPVRAEFFGDELLSLREFDPASQRSVRPLQEMIALPVVEVPLGDDACEAAIRALRAAEQTQGGQVSFEMTKALEDRRPFPGMDAYLPYFYPETADLLQYVAPDAVLVLADPGGLEARVRDFAERCLACGVRRGKSDASRTSRLTPRATSECACTLAINAPLLDRTDLKAKLSLRPRINLEEFARTN